MWTNPWVIYFGAPLAVLVVFELGRRTVMRLRRRRVAGQWATIQGPSGGTNIAAAGDIGTVNVQGPSATELATAAVEVRYKVLEDRLSLAKSLEANVQQAMAELNAILDNVGRASGDGLRQRTSLEGLYRDYQALRPTWGALHRTDLVEYVDRWYEQIVQVCERMKENGESVEPVEQFKRVVNYGGGVRNSVEELRKAIEAELRRET